MNRTKKDFDKFFPLLGVQDNIVISKRGDFTIGWELTLPVAYSLLAEEYDDFAAAWSSAVKVLPPWCIVHRQDWFLYEKYKPQEEKDFLTRSFENHFKGRDYLVHHAYVFLTFSNKARVNNKNSKSGFLQDLTFKPKPVDLKTMQEYVNKASEFISNVTRVKYVQERLLTDEDYLGTEEKPGLIQRYLMFGDSSPVLSDIEFRPDQVRVADKYMVSFAVNEVDLLPAEISNTDKVDALSGINSEVYLSTGSKLGILLDCNHIVNHYIVTLPQEATIHNLERKMKRMESGSERGADNRVGAEEINDFIEDVQTDSRIVVQTHCNILAFDTEKHLPYLRTKVSTALSSMDFTASYNLFDTPILYFSGIPGAESELGSDNLMTMELDTALCLGCMETFEREMEGGNFRTVDSIRHKPITIDLQKIAQDNGLIDNYNAFVVGGSGSGKSFFCNFYLRNCYYRGNSVYIIDVGDSYQGITRVINEETGGKDGLYYSWDRDHPLSFNPFVGYKGWLSVDGELNQDEPGLNAFISSLHTMWTPAHGWTDDMKSILNNIVKEFVVEDTKTRKDGSSPIFDDFCSFVDKKVVNPIRKGKYFCYGVNISIERFDVDSFLLALNPYRKGSQFGFLLNDPAPQDLFSNRWAVFEVDKLSQASDPKFYSLVILWIMNSFDMKMRSNSEFKILVIEEAWKAIANESMSGYIGGLFKTARKFFCSAMVVTQQLSDIMSSSVIKDTILKNSSIRILLDQSNNQNNFDEIQELLGLTDIDKNLCLSLNRNNKSKFNGRFKQVFISWGAKKRGVYNTEVSLEEALAYESEKVKKQKVLKRAEDTGSFIGAITDCANIIKASK